MESSEGEEGGLLEVVERRIEARINRALAGFAADGLVRFPLYYFFLSINICLNQFRGVAGLHFDQYSSLKFFFPFVS